MHTQDGMQTKISRRQKQQETYAIYVILKNALKWRNVKYRGHLFKIRGYKIV